MMRTKLFRCMAIVGVICAFSSIAAANDFSITWRDSPPSYSYYYLTDAGTQFTFMLSDPATGCPPISSSSTACAGFYNATGETLTGFEFQFVVPNSLATQTISYDSTNSPFTTFSCSDSGSGSCSGGLQTGDVVTLDFGVASISSGLLDGTLFYLYLNGVSPSDFPSGLDGMVTVVPEPGSMLLLGGGLGLLVLLGFRRRRVKARC